MLRRRDADLMCLIDLYVDGFFDDDLIDLLDTPVSQYSDGSQHSVGSDSRSNEDQALRFQNIRGFTLPPHLVQPSVSSTESTANISATLSQVDAATQTKYSDWQYSYIPPIRYTLDNSIRFSSDPAVSRTLNYKRCPGPTSVCFRDVAIECHPLGDFGAYWNQMQGLFGLAVPCKFSGELL